ncbi:MAG: glycosyltransferase, partial [Terracidiphilus sp.]
MPHILAQAIEILTTALAVAGMGYFLASIVAARIFLRERRSVKAEYAPGISILKSLKGLDPGMMDAFRSHCRQNYAGEYELLFGVSSLNDPAAAAVKELAAEFPENGIRLIDCPERLGTNGKVSTLAQLACHARHDVLLINDSDITVGPRYLARIARCFAPAENASGVKAPISVSGMRNGTAKAVPFQGNVARNEVGLVTALYRGKAHGSFWRGGGLSSRLEALGIATDFIPGVLLSKWIEGGLHYGLG